MNGYLLDTNICVFLLRQKYSVADRLLNAGIKNCSISEITVAELLYGAYCSNNLQQNIKAVNIFCERFNVLSITESLSLYAKERARLRRSGITVEPFDLLIGCTAVTNNLIMVTENTKHFININGIELENWIER